MNTFRILIHYGKHGDQYWLADTPTQAQQAHKTLFQQLDVEGFYGDNNNLIKSARKGDPKAISAILNSHRINEYEGWEYAKISVPSNIDPSDIAKSLNNRPRQLSTQNRRGKGDESRLITVTLNHCNTESLKIINI